MASRFEMSALRSISPSADGTSTTWDAGAGPTGSVSATRCGSGAAGGVAGSAPCASTARWAAEWLDGVADGSYTMSQRKRSSVEKRGGGLEAVKALARERGVHLLLLEDDKGEELVAASTKPFEVVC